jgi:class 3 adenylate cyclase
LPYISGIDALKALREDDATAHISVVVPDHADRAANMSLDMLVAIQDFNTSSQHPLNIRIGISTGAAVAGIVGKTKFPYNLWGDVVNTSSWMESHGTEGWIQTSEATRQALIHTFSLKHLGVIEVKGKGEMSTWFLKSPAVN